HPRSRGDARRIERRRRGDPAARRAGAPGNNAGGSNAGGAPSGGGSHGGSGSRLGDLYAALATGCGYDYRAIDAMTLAEAEEIFAYWVQNPPTHLMVQVIARAPRWQPAP